MKNTLLIIWNVLLTIGMGVLLFHIFNEHHEPENSATAVQVNDSTPLKIAYVNIDTLEVHYDLFTQKKKELDAKQTQMQNLYQKKVQDAQNEYASAQKLAPTMTDAQLKAEDEKLQKMQADIQQLQDAMSNDFQNQLDKFNGELKDSLDSYLKSYNADKRFTYVLSAGEGSGILYSLPQLDVTQDVIKGMNARLKK